MMIALQKIVWKRLGCGKALLLSLLIAAAWPAPPKLLGQERPLAFKHLTIDDGLSQSLIHAILQDRTGYMWFGTQDGLNRYDGYRFTVFKNDPFDSTSISGNEVTALYEDGKGNLWVGAGMLNRFDPRTERFERYALLPEQRERPSALSLAEICEDQNGALWLGTDRGLFRWRREEQRAEREGQRVKGEALQPRFTVTHYTHDPKDAASLSHNNVHTVYVDRRGVLWAGTHAGLDRLDLNATTAANAFTRFTFAEDGLSHNSVFAFYEDNEGVLWLGTFDGLSKLRLSGHGAASFKHYRHPPGVFAADWRGQVRDIEESGGGRDRKLWLTTFDALAIFDPVRETFEYVRHQEGESSSLSFNGLSSLHRDRANRMWVGTAGKGVDVFDPNAKAFKVYHGSRKRLESAFSVRSVQPVYEGPDSVLWINSNRGVGRLLRNRGVYEPVAHPGLTASDEIFRLLQDRTGRLWFTTHYGVYAYEPVTKQFTRYRHHPNDAGSLPDNNADLVYEDDEGELWFTIRGMIAKFDRDGERFTTYRQAGAEIETFECMVRDRNKVLWLGWNGGLVRFDPGTGSLRHFRNDPADRSSLGFNSIYSLCLDPRAPEKYLWVGTAGGGLNRLDLQTEKFTHFTEKDGLPNNVIYAILPDASGNLWMSTNKGLSQLLLAGESATPRFRNYDVSDGLQSNEFNRAGYGMSRSGELFFGGINGLNAFFPGEIKDNPYAPPVVFTDFKLFYKSISWRDKNSPLTQAIATTPALTLTHAQNVFTVEFAGLDFTAPERNRYAYKLENFNEDWIETGTERTATFINLPPGNYVLRVKGSNNDGVWNEEAASLKITITPPWWQTWWAYLLYAFFAIATLAAIYKTRVRYLKKRAVELETTVLERTAEVVAQKQRIEKQNAQLETQAEKLTELDRMKSRFFANISHEFRTPLTLILGPMEQALQETPEGKARSRLRLAHTNAQRLLGLINQLLDLSKLESGKMPLRAAPGNLVEFLQNLATAFAPLAERKRIALRFESKEKKLLVYFDRDKAEKIFGNLLSNAMKFTPEGGEIVVSVERMKGEERRVMGEERPSPFTPRPSPFALHPSSNEFVEITVRDTGIGIPAEKLPHIFDRFYQVDASATREYEGTGIGLALVKELVELHHGTVSVASKVGQGTTFTVSLPLGKGHLAPEEILEISEQYSVAQASLPADKMSALHPFAESEQSSVTSERVTTNDQRPATSNQQPATSDQQQASSDEQRDLVLIVEDHAEMRRYVRQELEPAYRVLEAADGEEGLAAALEAIPDVVISDVMMPKMNGYELCSRLKTDERTSHVPVILLTAKADQPDKLAGLETGADDYLGKPFDRHELVARVKNLIALRRKLRERFTKQIVLKPSEVRVENQDEAFLKKIMTIIEEHLGDEDFDVDLLCRSVGMSRAQLQRKLKALVNQSPMELVRTMRLERAADLLRQNAGSIAEIAYQVGFSSQAHFTRSFHEHFGAPPSEFKKAQQS
jgi:signal transduction histidine kinase/ligand-binding sensor domain-containing protein/DNA-binding response OmpR family regulator